jgi:hypothetical protein
MEEAKLVHYLSGVTSLTHLPKEIRLKLSRYLLACCLVKPWPYLNFIV